MDSSGAVVTCMTYCTYIKGSSLGKWSPAPPVEEVAIRWAALTSLYNYWNIEAFNSEAILEEANQGYQIFGDVFYAMQRLYFMNSSNQQ